MVLARVTSFHTPFCFRIFFLVEILEVGINQVKKEFSVKVFKLDLNWPLSFMLCCLHDVHEHGLKPKCLSTLHTVNYMCHEIVVLAPFVEHCLVNRDPFRSTLAP